MGQKEEIEVTMGVDVRRRGWCWMVQAKIER